MSDDGEFFDEDALGMAEVYEMDRDTFDNAEAFVMLDGHEGVECGACHRVRCWHCHAVRPCLCDEGGEISARESRDMYARAGLGPSRRQRP